MQDQEQRAQLVAEIAGFLGAWQRQLNDRAAPDAHQVSDGRSRAELLRARAAELGIGGLVHHLARCSACLGRLPLDRFELRGCLRTISEITWQLREELKRSAETPAGRNAEPIRGQAPDPEPPPRLTGKRDSPGEAPARPASDIPLRLHSPVPDGRLAQSLMAPPLLSCASLSPESIASALVHADAPSSLPPALDASSSLPGVEPKNVALAPASSRAMALPFHERREPGSPGLLATLFGLRAFGQSKVSVHRERGNERAAAPSVPRRVSGLLGFRTGIRPVAPLAAPPLVTRRGALPPLASALSPALDDGAAVNDDLDARLRQLRRGQTRPRSRAEARTTGTRADRSLLARWSGASWAVVLGVMVLGGVLLGKALLVLDRRLQAGAREPEAVALPLEAAPEAVGTNPSQPVTATRQFQELVVQVHGWGGEESPELAALLNAEAHATYRALSQDCPAGSSSCEGQLLAQDLLTPRAVQRHPAQAPGAPLPRWLAGLKIPAIGAHDDPEVQRWVEYYTSHSVGRELFQTMLFRCGAHQDLIDKMLVHHGLPLDLLAVVLTESACVPSAESAVGARGLWQFMAPTARAYHLYVQEGVVDERLSPVKSTEAAVKFLADLYRKMGSWEMAFASYNAGSGPFRILARLRQAGGSATFWDLAEAQLIPEETARYVPRIQAYAVILANLRHFDFSTAQLRTAEETSDLEVPSRTRLGQVARAAGTSVAYLRSLNPDLVGTVVPNLPNNRFVLQVPKASAHRARETLGQFLLEQLDLCVPSAFDWGRERFTAEMQGRCATHLPK